MKVLDHILKETHSKEIVSTERIQDLWSGYGEIFRVVLKGGNFNCIVCKHIKLPSSQSHPRGWNTSTSNLRKIKSYKVEMAFYKTFSHRCTEFCKVPKYLSSSENPDTNESLILLEDLNDSGYYKRKENLSVKEVKVCLEWLANFHAQFLNIQTIDLWDIGSYWHLATRPDEFNAMPSSKLKNEARRIDKVLNSCKYQTIIHGDAKVANFCFNSDYSRVAAVDFQYAGRGCGIKDVIYLLGSCLTEHECKFHETELLEYYFSALSIALNIKPSVDFEALKKEWLMMYPIAWTDFTRFLIGWLPSHHKINSYSNELIVRTFKILT